MNFKRLRVSLATALGALLIAGVGVAMADETPSSTEGAEDAAAQHTACLAANPSIDDTVFSNVQYDDETGACSLDTGGTDNEVEE
jgi:hypothetical protein